MVLKKDRRQFLYGVAGAAILLPGCASAPEHGDAKSAANEPSDDVSPPEDLMREHGALNRILLIYEEGERRLLATESIPSEPIEAIAKSADIIRRFIEGYHEKLEEDFLFPRFEKKSVLVDLVATLRRQHQAGRVLTESILQSATTRALEQTDARKRLAETLRLFGRMYRPHEAREDTVLFPAFRRLVSAKELAALGDQFEDKEHQLFGKEGFEGVVVEIAKLEEVLGIANLNQFTPST